MNEKEFRPWGYYTVIEQGEGFIVKIIHVNKEQRLSLQSHNYRSEHGVVLTGKARVVLDAKTFDLNIGQSVDIALRAHHSLPNPFEQDLEILEMQLGEKLSEEDIIRMKTSMAEYNFLLKVKCETKLKVLLNTGNIG